MPPPGAGKQPNGDEEEQKPESHFAAFENQGEQNDSDQAGSDCGPVVTVEFVKKFFDAIKVHIWEGGGASYSLHWFKTVSNERFAKL